MIWSTAFVALSLLYPRPDTSVVAHVGHYTISAGELMESYEFGPTFVKTRGGEESPLRRHLEFMIYERLIALKAEQLGYDTTAFFTDRVAALEEDLAVDELYRDEILSKVTITDEELAEGVRKTRIHTRFRWIYAGTADEANRIALALKNGAGFDSLFAVQGDENKSLETTVLRLEKDNPDLARELSGVQSQEIRGPITGSDGFYIIRIDEIWQNPILTESEEVRLRHEAVRALTTMKADQRAAAYVRTKMQSANPVIKGEGLSIVRTLLAVKGLSRERREEWGISETIMTEAGPRPVNAHPELLGETLVSFGTLHFTVRDYLRWFEIRQFQLKTRSPAAFTSSIKRTIWKMVQDHMLSREAYTRGMHQLKSVERDRRTWEAKILYLAGRAHFLKMVDITDQEIREKYESGKGRYKDGSGRVMAFEEARRDVYYALLREKEVRILYRTIQQLKHEFDIRVNEEMVRKLSASLKPDVSPVDVIFYKPGGTFPRRAFPTIDEQWMLFY